MAYEFVDKQGTPVTTKVGNYVFEDKPVEQKQSGIERFMRKANKFMTGSETGEGSSAVQQFATAPVGLARGIASTGQGVADRLDRTNAKILGKKAPDEAILAQREFDKKMTKKVLGPMAESNLYKGSQEVGKFVGQTAMTAPIYSVAGPSTALGRIGVAGLKGALATQVSNIAGEGKGATLGETALGVGTNMFLQGLGEAKKGLYTKAFKQTKASLAEKGYHFEKKTPGQLVMEQNLKPNVKKGLEQIQNNMQETRKAVESTADKAGTFKGSSIKGGIKTDILSKLGFDKLNQKAPETKNLISKVGKLVDDYIPKGKMTGNELVQQIKNLNATLPDKLKGMGIENVVSQKGMTQALTKTLKSVLDNLATKGGATEGTIDNLYKTYSKQSLVKQILENENIRKTLGRQLVGAGIGATIGGYSGIEDFRQGDIGRGLIKIIGGGVLGSVGMKLANNPNILMKVGNFLSKIGSQPVQRTAAILSSKVKK